MLRKHRLIWALAVLTATAQPAHAQSAPPAPQARFVVVLDAAHGGDDAGGRLGDGEPEKNVTLALSVRLRSLLAARGFSVVTTRESDAAVPLETRAEIANHAQAQACLSLHASASGTGIHLFTSALAPVQPTRFPPWKTAQAAWITRSLELAGTVNSALEQAGMNVTLGRIDLPGMDSFACPLVIVEIAPAAASGGNPAARPDDADYQARVSSALAAALVEWRSNAWSAGSRQP